MHLGGHLGAKGDGWWWWRWERRLLEAALNALLGILLTSVDKQKCTGFGFEVKVERRGEEGRGEGLGLGDRDTGCVPAYPL